MTLDASTENSTVILSTRTGSSTALSNERAVITTVAPTMTVNGTVIPTLTSAALVTTVPILLGRFTQALPGGTTGGGTVDV
jgi:hypothetical protein